MSTIKGKISQVIGPVIDVSFDKGVSLPNILDALVVEKEDGTKVILEVQRFHLRGLANVNGINYLNEKYNNQINE